MFTSFYNVLRSEISKNSLSGFNLFSYSNIYIFKYVTVRLLSYYSSSKLNLSTNVINLSVRWGLFFYKSTLLLLLAFLLG